MNEQAQFSISGDEMKVALEAYFGTQLGTFACENFVLKRLNGQQAERINQLTLENEGLRERLHYAEAELAQRPVPLSPEAAALAAEGGAVIAGEEIGGKEIGGKEKAAPVEAA